ncbi:MAG: helix-hairpin-helix domain-containing protein [Candidatus Eisenbacteria bacterium]|nr:helix-hairpin-helix domain-containing protein [Candidatus Eisenbacteria bacterium]
MAGLRSRAALLTREERVVFLTVSLCLLGGGLFHIALLLFDLPDALDPRTDWTSWPDGETGAESEAKSRGSAADDGSWVSGSGGARELAAAGEDAFRGSGVGRAGGGAGGSEAAPAGMLDLNFATQAELEELPGIGPALARRILEHRARVGRFKRVEDLLDVRGVGEKILSRLRAHVYVSRTRE